MLRCLSFHAVSHCPDSSIHTVSCKPFATQKPTIVCHRLDYEVVQRVTFSTRTGRRESKCRDVHPEPIKTRENVFSLSEDMDIFAQLAAIKRRSGDAPWQGGALRPRQAALVDMLLCKHSKDVSHMFCLFSRC